MKEPKIWLWQKGQKDIYEFIYGIFKNVYYENLQTARLKEVFNECPYAHHLDSTINILLFLFCQIAIHQSIHLCMCGI